MKIHSSGREQMNREQAFQARTKRGAEFRKINNSSKLMPTNLGTQQETRVVNNFSHRFPASSTLGWDCQRMSTELFWHSDFGRLSVWRPRSHDDLQQAIVDCFRWQQWTAGDCFGVTAKEEINRFRLNLATFVTAYSSRQSATFGFLMWNDLLLHGRRQWMKRWHSFHQLQYKSVTMRTKRDHKKRIKKESTIPSHWAIRHTGHNSLLFMCWKITSDLAICAFTEGPSYGEAWASSTSLPLGRGLHSVSAQVYIYKLTRVLTKIRYTVYVRVIKWTSCMNSLTIYMHYSILWSFDIPCVCSM